MHVRERAGGCRAGAVEVAVAAAVGRCGRCGRCWRGSGWRRRRGVCGIVAAAARVGPGHCSLVRRWPGATLRLVSSCGAKSVTRSARRRWLSASSSVDPADGTGEAAGLGASRRFAGLVLTSPRRRVMAASRSEVIAPRDSARSASLPVSSNARSRLIVRLGCGEFPASAKQNACASRSPSARGWPPVGVQAQRVQRGQVGVDRVLTGPVAARPAGFFLISTTDNPAALQHPGPVTRYRRCGCPRARPPPAGRGLLGVRRSLRHSRARRCRSSAWRWWRDWARSIQAPASHDAVSSLEEAVTASAWAGGLPFRSPLACSAWARLQWRSPSARRSYAEVLVHIRQAANQANDGQTGAGTAGSGQLGTRFRGNDR